MSTHAACDVGLVRGDPRRVPKLAGSDCELAAFIQGEERRGGTGWPAATALLREFDGIPERRWRSGGAGGYGLAASAGGYGSASWAYSSGGWGSAAEADWRPVRAQDGAEWESAWQDYGRMYLPANGACVYIDLGHLELCTPEVLSAHEHVAACHAMLRLTREAMARANQQRPADRPIRVLVNSSDGHGNSYGSHLNVLVSRDCYDNIFHRKMHYMLLLASFQVSSIVLTGQGKVGSENGAPPAAFQVSQRADFFACLTAPWTTHHRPLVNSRDEALVGAPWRRLGAGGAGRPTREDDYARLHCIFHDATLSQPACLLKVGLMQIVLAMIEAEALHDLAGLALEDPLQALHTWSHDPGLTRTAALIGGRRVTAVELQQAFFQAAHRFVASGEAAGIVPRVEEIVALWGDTLDKLARRDHAALVGRLDWVLKQQLLLQALDEHRDWDWSSPELKVLDLLFASLDQDGLFWAMQREVGERVVTDAMIERLTREPPPTTRAYGRAMLLRSAGADQVSEIDWDRISFTLRGEGKVRECLTLDMADPLAFTRADLRVAQGRGRESLRDVIEALG